MKHTPGPWDCENAMVSSGKIKQITHISNLIADVGWIGSGLLLDEQIANARLIAAAPELLEALEALVAGPSDCWRDATDDDDGYTRTPRQRVLKQAHAAIAKAIEEGL